MCVCVLSHVLLLATLWTIAHWDSSGKNTGVGCHFLLQGIFLTQGWTRICVSCIGSRLFTTEPPGKPRSKTGDPQLPRWSEL